MAFSFLSDGAYAPSSPVDVWSTLKCPTNPAYNDADNLHMAMAIGAVGNGWGATTAQDLATLSGKQDWVLYPILHRVLHGKAAETFCTTTGAALNKRAREMLDELPANGEPSNPRPGPAAVHGFTVSNRFIRSKDQHYVGQLGGEGMRYSGTDYMLLHNLYAIATPSTWTQGPSASPCSAPASVDAGIGGSGGASSGATTSGGSPNGNDDPTTDSGAGPSAGEASGCGCRSTTSTSTTGGVMLASIAGAMLFALRARRRR
jgi:hypothetical protein